MTSKVLAAAREGAAQNEAYLHLAELFRNGRLDDDPLVKAGVAAINAYRQRTEGGVVKALTDGWNACRKSIYAVCEDVDREAEETYLAASKSKSVTSTEGHLTEFQAGHVAGYRSGMVRAAKSIARGFNSMEAEDDDNFREAITALRAKGREGGWREVRELVGRLEQQVKVAHQYAEADLRTTKAPTSTFAIMVGHFGTIAKELRAALPTPPKAEGRE